MTTNLTYADTPWTAHYEAGVPEHIDYEETSLPEFLERSARDFPDHMALLFQGYRVTYRELMVMVDRFAAVPAGFGVKKGDSYCKDKLAAYKLPSMIEFRDELPKTNVGKVLKKDLRAEELAKEKG